MISLETLQCYNADRYTPAGGSQGSMTRRLVLAILFFPYLVAHPSVHPSFAQTPDEQPSPPSIIESPAPTPPVDEHHRSEFTEREREDAVFMLGKLRGNVRTSPRSADDRLKLAEGLYRIGDLDAAIDECRIAIALNPDDARAHLQLGIALMAKQDWRAALAELKEATRLNPELTQAHYNLGTVYYTTGNLKAAIGSYRQALELQSSFPRRPLPAGAGVEAGPSRPGVRPIHGRGSPGRCPAGAVLSRKCLSHGPGSREERRGSPSTGGPRQSSSDTQPAATSLSQLRRQALSTTQPEKKRREALEAFHAYREKLWNDFPDLTRSRRQRDSGNHAAEAESRRQRCPGASTGKLCAQ